MRRKIPPLLLLVLAIVLSLTGCGQSVEKKTTDTKKVANQYYLDLSSLGMNLTVYLKLEEDGNFLFSNTLDFENNKSSGTFKESDGAYLMVFSSVNGEEKLASDGLTSSFVLTEEGNLDFTVCDLVYYGSAKITTTSEEHPGAKLTGIVVPENYEAPDMTSDFQMGFYTATAENEETCEYRMTFYEDGSYLLVTCYEQNDQLCYAYETGSYGVNADQLALEPEENTRLSGEVLDENTLKLSVYPFAGAEKREMILFNREEQPSLIAELTGEGTANEEKFEVALRFYEDGSYESTVADFKETGILVLDTEKEYAKQYPDHPETGVRGLNQVSTVPAGTCAYEAEKMTLGGLRIRKSAGLSRYECTVSE